MKYKQVVASYPQTIIRWSGLHSSICSNYILKAKQNNNDNNVHEEKRTKDTEGPTFFLNQLFLAASRFWVSWCDIHEILIWKFLNVYHDVEDGTNGLGSGSGGEEVLKREGHLFMVFTVLVHGVRGKGRLRRWWWNRGWDFEDLDVRVLAERGGDGGGEIGGDDESGLEVSRSYVFA